MFGLFSVLMLPAARAHADTSLAAAVLPASRSVQSGVTATLFATVINAGTEAATGCRIEAPTGLPVSFSYQTTDALTNEVTGTADTPVSIPIGGSQSFLIAMTPSQAIAPDDVKMGFLCDNAPDVGTIVGVNTFTFSASDTPVADVVALALTASRDGVVVIPTNTNVAAFSVASVNLGALDTLTVTAAPTSSAIAAVVSLCETNPVTGVCVNPATPTLGAVTTTIAPNETPTFAVFTTATGDIEFSPGVNRIALQFADGSGAVRGATSVAVRTEQVVSITPGELVGTTMWGAPARADRVDWSGYGVQFNADNTGTSYENLLVGGTGGVFEDVSRPFTWTLTNGKLVQEFTENFTVQLSFDGSQFLSQVEFLGFPLAVTDFLQNRFNMNTLVGPFEARRNIIRRNSSASALDDGRLRVTAITTVNFSIDEALIANGWTDPLPSSPETSEPSQTLDITTAPTVAQAVGQTAAAGDVWAVPFPYSPQDPSLITPAPIGYFVDTVELLANGATTPGRLSGRTFNWLNEGNTLVLEDGNERHRVTTLALRGDERQAIVEYVVAGELELLSGVRVALGNNAGSTLAADLPADPQATTLQVWHAGINSWRSAALAADGRLLPGEIFGYVFPNSTDSYRVFGNSVEQQNCPDPTIACFTGGPSQIWDWVSAGDLVTRSLATSALTRVRTWQVLSYQPGGLAVVVESAVWTFNGEDPEVTITPRITTLELIDLGDYPAELANSPQVN